MSPAGIGSRPANGRRAPGWALGAYAGATLLGGALLAPPAYWLGRALVHGHWLPALAPFGFATYLRRCWLLLAIVSLPQLTRRLPRGLLRWRPGAASWPQARRQLALGTALGFLGVGTLAFGLCAAGWLQLRPLSAAVLLRILATSALSGAAVAAVEELAFRGALLRALSQRLGAAAGAGVQVLAFAAVHFVAAPSPAVPGAAVGWSAGLWALAALLRPFTDPAALLERLLTLLAVGTTLTLAARRAGTLWLSLGLHGAWVFGLRFVAQACLRLRPADAWLDRELRAGLLPLALAVGTGLLLLALPRRWLHVVRAGRPGDDGP